VDSVPAGIGKLYTAVDIAFSKKMTQAEDDLRCWHLILGRSDRYDAVDATAATEWLLIDPDHQTRFGHRYVTLSGLPRRSLCRCYIGDMNLCHRCHLWCVRHRGDTVIPGAGHPKWRHLYRQLSRTPREDMNELPWQVVFLHTAESVAEYRQREAAHAEYIEFSLSGRGLPPTEPCLGLTSPGDGSCLAEEDPARGRMGWDSSTGLAAGPLISSQLPLHTEADATHAHGNFARSAELFAAARDGGCGAGCTSPLSVAWHETVLRTRQAEAHRRNREFAKGLEQLRLAVRARAIP
jgi:hypothetical protein